MIPSRGKSKLYSIFFFLLFSFFPFAVLFLIFFFVVAGV